MSFFRRVPKYRNKNKFGAVRTNGMASKLEASVFTLLQIHKRGGLIKDIRQQIVVKLSEAEINYKVDFCYTRIDNEEVIYVEAKGYPTDTWNLKKRLWKFYGPGILEIYTGSFRRPTLSETVVPKNYTTKENVK
jgi:hypothetical protein